jgi:hypothetical protein
MALEWSDVHPPTKDVSHYTHTEAQTPMGIIRLEWKGWKENGDSPIAQMPWGEFVVGVDLDDAKQEVQAAWDKMAKAMVPYCSPR